MATNLIPTSIEDRSRIYQQLVSLAEKLGAIYEVKHDESGRAASVEIFIPELTPVPNKAPQLGSNDPVPVIKMV